MYTFYSSLNKTAYGTVLSMLGITLLGSCGQSHQLGVEENPQEILETKLSNKDAVLTPMESVALLGHCVELGKQNLESVHGKQVIATLGSTGAGKSTLINSMNMRKSNVTPVTQQPEKTVNRAITQTEVDETIAYLARRKEVGQQNAVDYNHKNALFVLGQTGSGKSTLINSMDMRKSNVTPVTQQPAKAVNRAITQTEVDEAIAYLARRKEVGQQKAAAYNDIDALLALGMTGSGKSTATNYWMGRNMVRRTPDEMEALGVQRELEDVVVVDPDSEQVEVAPIGHGRASCTSMPQLVDLKASEATLQEAKAKFKA